MNLPSGIYRASHTRTSLGVTSGLAVSASEIPVGRGLRAFGEPCSTPSFADDPLDAPRPSGIAASYRPHARSSTGPGMTTVQQDLEGPLADLGGAQTSGSPGSSSNLLTAMGLLVVILLATVLADPRLSWVKAAGRVGPERWNSSATQRSTGRAYGSGLAPMAPMSAR